MSTVPTGQTPGRGTTPPINIQPTTPRVGDFTLKDSSNSNKRVLNSVLSAMVQSDSVKMSAGTKSDPTDKSISGKLEHPRGKDEVRKGRYSSGETLKTNSLINKADLMLRRKSEQECHKPVQDSTVRPGQIKPSQVPFSDKLTKSVQNSLLEQCVGESSSTPSSSQSPRTPGSPRKRRMSGDRHPTPRLQISLPYFLRLIEHDPISFDRWKNLVVSEIAERVSKEKNCSSINEVVNTVFETCLEHSNILNRIESAVNILGDHDYGYLKIFSAVFNPIKFNLLLNNQIHSHLLKDVNFLSIIGGPDSLKIINECSERNGDKIKEVFKKALDVHLFHESYEKRSNAISHFVVHFEPGFDQHVGNLPIFLSDVTELRKRFGIFYSSTFVSRGIIKLNDNIVFTPAMEVKRAKEMSEPEREEYFIEWLIGTLNRCIDKNAKQFFDVIKSQRKLFLENPMDISKFKKDELKSGVALKLMNCFGEKTHRQNIKFRFMLFLAKLQMEKSTADFAYQMGFFAGEISKYLEAQTEFQDGSWNGVSDNLIDLYFRLYKLPEKYCAIPCLSIIKAMLDSREEAHRFIQEVLCERLSQKNSAYQLHLDPESTDISTCYDIRYSNGAFWVTHVKSCRIINADLISKARFDFYWRLRGKLNSCEYASEFEIYNLARDPNCSEEEGLKMLNLFDLDFDDTPWGHYVTKRFNKSDLRRVNFALLPEGGSGVYKQNAILHHL
jgi:hypothetical protein